MPIAVISWPHDIHFLAVAAVFENAGLKYKFIQGLDFPALERQSVFIGSFGFGHRARIANSHYSLSDFDTVWYRRGHRPGVGHIPTESDKTFVRVECENFLVGLRETASRSNRWVNHPEAQQRALNKVNQLAAAQAIGARIPETLISNDPNEVERFLTAHPKVIGKTFTPAFWRSSSEPDYAVSNTFEMSIQDFDPDAISAAPVIFQERIQKQREWRVCVFKDRVEAFIIFDADLETETHVDNRVMHGLPGRYAIKGELPSEVVDWIMALIAEFELEMGQFDFLETRDGFIFLEVNPGGQFLFLEAWNKDAGLLAAFLEFLTHGVPITTGQAKTFSAARFEMTPAFVSATDRIAAREAELHSKETEQNHVYVD